MDLDLARPKETVARGGTRHRRPVVRWQTVAQHAVLIFFCLVVVMPLLWVVVLSLKTAPEVYSATFPRVPQFSNYLYPLQQIQTLPRNYLNSVMVTGSTIVITSTCAVLASYAIVWVKSWLTRLVFMVLVASMFFPTQITSVIGIWQIQERLKLLNTTGGLILPYATLSLALSVFVMRGFFQGISTEIADAARIDGCGAWSTLWHVMLPMVRNGLVTLVIINFVPAWGEYLLAFTLTNDESVRTLPVVLATVDGGMGEWSWPRLAAVLVMAIAPGLIGFFIAQRWYFKGIQEGALKG